MEREGKGRKSVYGIKFEKKKKVEWSGSGGML
jgi:hypothetical protein